MAEKEVLWANPAAAGIVGLCSVVIPLSALNLGWIPPQAAPLLLPWLIFGGLVQVITGIIEYRRGGLLFATPLLVFGLLLCLTPALGEIIKIWIHNMEVPPALNGLGFLVVAVFVIPFFISTGLVSSVVFTACLLLDVGLWLVVLAMLGVSPAMGSIGWMVLLIFALIMLYVACALFLNESFGKPILSIGGPLFKRG
jgi:succinate-acetate transporter protein